MHPAVISVIISGTLLVVLMALFSYEARRGVRMLATPRLWFDDRVIGMYRMIGHLQIHFGTGAFRYYLHFCIHKVLSVALGLLKASEQFLAQIQRHNKAVARSVQEEQEGNHLRLIAEHKASTALTEKQKERLKERSLG